MLEGDTVQRRWKDGVPEGMDKVGRASARGYKERGGGRGVLEDVQVHCMYTVQRWLGEGVTEGIWRG